MNKKAAAITAVIIFAFTISILNPLPSGEIVSRKETRETITILAGQSTSDAGIEEMIDHVLTEKFPEVHFEWLCVDWGDKFASQLEGKFVSGDIPDILIGKAQDVKTNQIKGMIAPLSEKAYQQISDDSRDIVTVGGEVYGIPYTESFQGVLYNKDIFASYGLEPPRTLGELEELVAVLEMNQVIPFACHFQENWKIGNMNMQFFMNDVFLREPAWGDYFRGYKVNYSDNDLIEQLFRNNQYILEHSFEDAIQINQYESDIRFAKGEAAMYLTGTWSLQATSQMVPETNVGIFPYPNRTGDAKLLLETNITFMKVNKTENSELIDEILAEIGTNLSLAKEIVDYTQSLSTFQELIGYGEISVMEDISSYQESGRLLDVSIGNGQLIWTYQNDVAAEALLWLQGKQSLTKVFAYADRNRKGSVASTR